MSKQLEKMNRFTVSSVEAFFDGLLRGKLTDNLFFSEVQPSIYKTWNEFVIVDAGNVQRDKDAFMACTVLIQIYLRNNAYGVKDVKHMKQLEDKLNELIYNNDDPHYHINRRGSYSHYDAVNDIFFNMVQINLIVT